jgi:hypothetical protein
MDRQWMVPAEQEVLDICKRLNKKEEEDIEE